MTKLILVRGVPGSGKSTFVKKVNLWGRNYETDNYFVRPDGHYDFNSRLIKQAHEYTFNCVRDTLFLACEFNEDVYVSNTFTHLWEMQKYTELANEYNVELVVYRCTGEYQNVHGVPEEKVQQMKDRFEDYPGEIFV